MFRAVAIGVALLLTAAAVGAWGAWSELHRPQALPPSGVLISVAPGERFATVAGRLQQAGVVRVGWLLRVWARVHGLDRQVRAGDYQLTASLSPIAVLEVLRSPTAAVHTVTIPEGTTAAQIAATLAAHGFGGVDAFLCALRDPTVLADLDLPATGAEGYLFPDTYALQWSDRPEQIIGRMVSRFREVTTDLEAKRAPGMTRHQWVTLASIVEKETGAAPERPEVAAVFLNRLRLKWPLQSDPTVIYGIPDFDGNLTRPQLRQPTRYNTYTIPGLPPGPICNPGRAALAAVLDPAPGDSLYFVARGDGTHEFSHSLADHNRAVQRFQRRR